MEKQSFIALVKRYYPWICSMEKAAFRIHDDVNQKYDHVLPYGFHLKMTISYVSRYGYLVAETEADILILYASAFLHDTIEDARMTYNDVVKFLKEFKGRLCLAGRRETALGRPSSGNRIRLNE